MIFSRLVTNLLESSKKSVKTFKFCIYPFFLRFLLAQGFFLTAIGCENLLLTCGHLLYKGCESHTSFYSQNFFFPNIFIPRRVLKFLVQDNEFSGNEAFKFWWFSIFLYSRSYTCLLFCFFKAFWGFVVR